MFLLRRDELCYVLGPKGSPRGGFHWRNLPRPEGEGNHAVWGVSDVTAGAEAVR